MTIETHKVDYFRSILSVNQRSPSVRCFVVQVTVFLGINKCGRVCVQFKLIVSAVSSAVFQYLLFIGGE
jgi:hypothetical protein